jgi:ribosomal 30S subunit maturation factor RimM
LSPAVDGLNPNGEIRPVKLLKKSARASKGWVELDFEGDPESLKGAWICALKKDLIQRGKGVYYFQIVGLEVKKTDDGEVLGKIESIFDTAAHGILTIRTNDQKEILVPLVDEYVTLKLKENSVIIPSIDDFDQQ